MIEPKPFPAFADTKLASLTGAHPFTVIKGLVFAVMPVFVISLAVTVLVPAVFSVTLKVLIPEESAAFPGRLALPSLEVIPTVSVELTTFQAASTAFTVTVNGVPAVWAFALPVLPLPLLAVPGAAVSPGTRSCSFTNAPAFTVIGELVLGVFNPLVTSLAVRV